MSGHAENFILASVPLAFLAWGRGCAVVCAWLHGSESSVWVNDMGEHRGCGGEPALGPSSLLCIRALPVLNGDTCDPRKQPWA